MEERGPPGLLGGPLHACRRQSPRRTAPRLAHPRRGPHRLRAIQNPRHPERPKFRGRIPRPTRSPTYASPRPLPVPSQGWLLARAGSPLARWVSHPLDHFSKFQRGIASSLPLRPAGPGRTKFPSLCLASMILSLVRPALTGGVTRVRGAAGVLLYGGKPFGIRRERAERRPLVPCSVRAALIESRFQATCESCSHYRPDVSSPCVIRFA